MSISTSDHHLSSMTTYRVCFCYHRRFKQATTEPPEEIQNLFRKYSVNGTMGLEHLQRFLAEVQGETGVSKEAAQAILDRQKEFKHLNVFQKKSFSLDGFFRYIFSDDNPPISTSPGIHQDMEDPLSHYFIYTGHNSYLSGNQLYSECSDIPIIEALERGVRVIELDLWPNTQKDDVEVLHGRTLTTPVDLDKCLRSIKEHAFSASPYPVIITLEDHLTPGLQAKVAQAITETFGEMLHTSECEHLEEFPSPDSLKMKVIISSKPPKEYLESKATKDEAPELQKETEEESWGAEVMDLKAKLNSNVKMKLIKSEAPELRKETEEESWGAEVMDLKAKLNSNVELEHEPNEHFQEEEDHGDGDQKPHQIVAPEYKRLIVIAARKRKGGMSETLKVDPHSVTRVSLGEQVFEKAAISHGTELIRFTQKNMLRIYPKATRFTSSNYNPILGWMHGAQMVALNMQGYGRSLWLMHGLFRANGGCGYVKKPEFLRKTGPNDEVFDPKAAMPVKKTLKVRVYMGDGWRFDFHRTHFDKYSPPDFYTRVGIAGVPADTVMKRTKAIEDNWRPMWDEEFTFSLTIPELALLRIEVHEYDMSEKDDFGGQTCLPVWELKSGIRSVPLYDRKGERYKSVKLLMNFNFI